MFDKRAKNVEVFRDTENLCRTNAKLQNAIKESNTRQYVMKESDDLNLVKSSGSKNHRFEEPCKIIVSKKRTLEAASGYSVSKICIHNFASATNPGGGVTKVSSAQEEAICRISTLYFNISAEDVLADFHNRHGNLLREGKMDVRYNDDCIFTPGVTVFKTDTSVPELLEEKDWYQVDVITCAAPNLREQPGNSMNPGGGSKPIRLTDDELKSLHIKRMRRILSLAQKEQEDVVILGAFGCGAFCNSPRVVAEAMSEVIKEFQYDFRIIEFAVYCNPGNTLNYDEFNKRLGNSL